MKLYITFGQNHIHEINGKIFDKDCVAVVNCVDFEDVQNKAFEYFNSKFAFSYRRKKDVEIEYYPRGFIEI